MNARPGAIRTMVGVLLAVAVLAAGCGQLTRDGAVARAGGRVAPTHGRAALISRDPVLARLGMPAVTRGSGLPGYLMIADRDNNRVIIVDPRKRILWRFPMLGSAAQLSQPDDAFVSSDGRYITTNDEFADSIAVISLSRHPRIVWRYGHPGVQGSAAGYLAHPDDAYLLANGEVQVADIINCRVLWIDRAKRVVRAIGSPGDCVHDPPSALSDPNGDTPLPDGGVLVTEIGGWVDRLDRHGRLMWSIATSTTTPPMRNCCRTGTCWSRATTRRGGSTSSARAVGSCGLTVHRRGRGRSTTRRSPPPCRTARSR